ncbi:hypothetical protein ES705_24347 [subsurface metagenome]
MKKKEAHRQRLLEHLSDPANKFCNRTIMAKVCGIGQSTFYSHFTPQELDLIESEALSIRRTKYAAKLAAVDEALLKKAAEGDPRACKLCYERFEKWQGSEKVELSGEIKTTQENVSQDLLEMFKKSGYKKHE